jgi:hypothetical protein
MTVAGDKWLRFCERLAKLMRKASEGAAVHGRSQLEEASRLLDADEALTDSEVKAHLEYVIWEFGGSPGLYHEVVELLERGTSQEDFRRYFAE